MPVHTAAQVIIEKPNEVPTAVSNAKPAPKVILWPSNNSRPGAGNVAYLVRPQPMPTPVNVIRPSMMGQASVGQNTSLINHFMKPVMATGIYDHNHHPKKVDTIPRFPPIILPKPPVVSVAPTMTAAMMNPRTTMPSTSTPSFIVTTTMPSKVTSVTDPNLCGTTKHPIQLVQDGNVFK